jgi:hypothetical protein
VRLRGEHGQAAPEWIGLVLLVTVALTAALAAGLPVPGTDLARAVAARIACAASLRHCDGGAGALALAYGPELADLVAEHTPRLEYEEGMRALPVDFRDCREDACAEGPATGPVSESNDGLAVTVFAHAVDCRDGAAAARDGYDCSGDRAGRVYLQYWLYYPGSATARAVLGDAGAHPDDWESFQIRLDPDGGAEARASSHHGYNGDSGNWLSDSGLVERSAWTESTGRYFISGGSHAGRVGERPRDRPEFARIPYRWTEPGAVRIIPIEPLAGGRFRFAVSPPWEKSVYLDPEHRGTG